MKRVSTILIRTAPALIRTAATLMLIVVSADSAISAETGSEERALPTSVENLVNGLSRQIAAIEPTAEDDKWRKIPWRIDLMAARVDAERENKPIFLWIMNGHPMGCT